MERTANLASLVAVTVLGLAAMLCAASTTLAHEGVEHATAAEAQIHLNTSVESELLRQPGSANAEANAKARVSVEEQSTSTRETYQERKAAREAALEERKETIQARFQEHRANVSARISENVLRITERIEARFTAAIERLEGIADRIESRAEKLTQRGADTGTTTEALAEARADLETAQRLTADLSVKIDAALESATPREQFSVARAAMSDIKSVLKEVHGHLRDAVVDLKAGATAEVETEAAAESEGEVE